MKKSQTPAASSGAAPQEREYDRLSDRLEAAGLPALECAEGQSCGSLDAVRALLSRLAPAAPQDEDEIQRLRAKLAVAQRQAKVYRGALEDILTADETSTLEGALAIARAALAAADAEIERLRREKRDAEADGWAESPDGHYTEIAEEDR